MTDEGNNPEGSFPQSGMPNDLICRIMIVLLLGNDAMQMGII